MKSRMRCCRGVMSVVSDPVSAMVVSLPHVVAPGHEQVNGTLAVRHGGCKHMFGNPFDIERTFVHHGSSMHRTYVRRRVTLLVACLGLTAALTGPITDALGASAGGMRPVSDRTYLVEPGDTLWAIASQVAGDRDPRQVVELLEASNGVDAGSLQPGMVLRVPGSR
jgi:nucleoid-associated protein YgaU